MTLNYYENNVPHLIEEYYQFTLSEKVIPFNSTIIPIGLTHITHAFYGNHNGMLKSDQKPVTGTILSGQFVRSYEFFSETKANYFGISFHPTALYKILNTDISKIKNKHVLLSKFHPEFDTKIDKVFEDYTTPEKMAESLNVFFSNIELTTNENTKTIDNVINLIKSKEGLLNIIDILDQIEMSQKTLENQFKKIVGLTPGKYIKLYRFSNLMRKYESQEIDFKKLIFMFNYYDRSHFARDFKLFMNETPKSYFKNDYPLIKAILKK
ncbi:helix-turn-helix domain-containing protein [Psychroserpens sp. Hel_I_66]|uniref:helix-turn-helix domain-containing protein n=1 Tax=Psychroserpens sp. Hel_I_66 TaxID=1250004 RepID=UPI0006477B59|nr:helix-turn-helix domain-containing protein [Psychroserpens sp. Hel_I_66]